MSINEAVERWGKMESRERDAWVAEHVMGFDVRGTALCSHYEGEYNVLTGRATWHGTPGDGYHSIQPVYVRYPDLAAVVPGEEDDECCGVDYVSLGVVPAYSSSPSDDYKVLETVRETWGPQEQGAFTDALFQILDSRTGGFNHLLQYAPGTYALAAYIVLESKGVGV